MGWRKIYKYDIVAEKYELKFSYQMKLWLSLSVIFISSNFKRHNRFIPTVDFVDMLRNGRKDGEFFKTSFYVVEW
ncbi:hypothetical protein Q649_00842 [Bartonella quintana JK 73]|uniref:Uncharacterized protein n=1 Tax=Bartonella quintana JK 73 TaxID=1402976 RepID=W3TZB4_BARQI|nr:hypothetical protein Q650_00833 [Bartonella quintana JK 73rel]ETS15893.1 hypothetical protein Q649_00842 [Bartonella quintana JK 73]KEC59878.1 hypothetical protein O93_00424 [Bartonella quintana JK 19]